MSRPKKKAAHDNKERLLIARFDLSLVAMAGLNWGRGAVGHGILFNSIR
jgi:hypothetical protein